MGGFTSRQTCVPGVTGTCIVNSEDVTSCTMTSTASNCDRSTKPVLCQQGTMYKTITVNPDCTNTITNTPPGTIIPTSTNPVTTGSGYIGWCNPDQLASPGAQSLQSLGMLSSTLQNLQAHGVTPQGWVGYHADSHIASQPMPLQNTAGASGSHGVTGPTGASESSESSGATGVIGTTGATNTSGTMISVQPASGATAGATVFIQPSPGGASGPNEHFTFAVNTQDRSTWKYILLCILVILILVWLYISLYNKV